MDQINNKTVAIFAGYYLPVIGGYIKNIHELARRLVDEGYCVDLITCNTEKSLNHEAVDGVQIYRLPCWNLLNGNYPVPKPSITTFKILHQIYVTDYDIINTQTRFFFVCFIGWALSWIKHIPLIHQERGSRHTVLNNRFLSMISELYDHTIGSLIVKSAKISFGVSNAAVEFLEHLGAKKTKVVYNGIDISVFKECPPDTEMIPKETINITYVGRLIYAKGVQDLISVFPDLHKDVRIFVVGDGSYKEELEKLANPIDNDKIKFLGAKDLTEIPSILNATDIFVNPSYSEGLPTSVMEACAAGCAVVATDVGGTSEIIKNGLNGYLINPSDTVDLKTKLNLLIEDSETRQEFGKRSESIVSTKFSWDTIVDDWDETIQHIYT